MDSAGYSLQSPSQVSPVQLNNILHLFQQQPMIMTCSNSTERSVSDYLANLSLFRIFFSQRMQKGCFDLNTERFDIHGLINKR